MAVKLKIRVGNVEIDYEGTEAFLNKKVPELIGIVAKFEGTGSESTAQKKKRVSGDGAGDTTLAAFLKKTNSKEPQWRKFLATAQWLHSKGEETLQTADVVKALKDNKQKKLANPSICFAANVTKGFCEKSGSKVFLVTGEGKTQLGIGNA